MNGNTSRVIGCKTNIENILVATKNPINLYIASTKSSILN